MTVRSFSPLLTLALFLLSPVLAQAGAPPTTGACCKGLACSIGSAAACDGLGGLYQGDGTTCRPGACGTVPPRNHFQCYDVQRRTFDPVALNLEDDFGSASATVRRTKMLCAPVNKNGEDPTAPNDADHLVAYEIRHDTRFAGVLDEIVEDQFGSLVLDVRRPERFLVPSAKQADPNDVVTPLDPPGIDHYQCYRVRGDRRRVAGITVEDQFGTGTTDVKKPSRLCLPVDKNGEGLVDGAARLMCYAIKPGPRVNATVQVNNQLGDDELRVRRARELCVPIDLEVFASGAQYTVNSFVDFTAGGSSGGAGFGLVTTELQTPGDLSIIAETTVANATGTLDFSVTLPKRSTYHNVQIHTEAASGPFLSDVAFVDSTSGEFAGLTSGALSSSDGALAANTANSFAFELGGGGPFGLTPSAGYAGEFDTINLVFSYDNPAGGETLELDAVGNLCR